MALETPFSADTNGRVILDKYLGILNNMFENIFESITGAGGEEREEGESKMDKNIPEKYLDKYN